MEEETIVDVERKLVGRSPYRYHLDKDTRTLPADSGFGAVGAKMDPKTGALMYDKYEDWITKEKIFKEEIKESNIRFSDDSSAVIIFREKENVRLSVDGEVVDHLSRGRVMLENRSEKDRIWDIRVGLHDDTGIAVLDFDRIGSQEIEPGNRTEKDYSIDLPGPSIALEEVISTHPDLAESRIICRGSETHATLQLGLKNLAIIPYRNVVVRKAVPGELKNIMFPEDSLEGVAIEDGELVWRIPDLGPGEMKVLRYEGDLDPNINDRIPTGDVNLTAISDDIITNIVIDSFEAMCRNMYAIEADETEEPGEWICRFVVENTSLFEVEVLRVEVKDPKSGRILVNLEDPGIYLGPGKRWETDPWMISQEEKPKFIKNLVLNVVPGLSRKVSYDLTKEGGSFHPASLSFKKVFDRKKVEARRTTDLVATLTVENTGNADIDQVFIRDSLPRYFLPPRMETITVEKAGMPLSDNVGVQVDPEQADPTEDQVFYIRVDDLSKFGAPLRNGERIVIRYTTTIHRPEPDERIEAPAEVDARTCLPGPVIKGEDVVGAPAIDTLQVVRKFSIGKSIEQGSRPGEYHIGLHYRNRGADPIIDLRIKDIIPENFKGSDYSIQPTLDTDNEGITMLEWTIPRVDPKQSVVISYSITGEGEYHPSDAQIFYNSED
ncbi:MAG: hypothetical protein JW939_03840 [Candidatus Thermoplasmatota archaeon]|nr:hypothetical protein [Candidatus Thermoplasmatota archaeon]